MPITVNGSANTITGLAAGGLPSGSVAAADITNGVIDYTKLVAGATIQHYYVKYTPSVIITSTSYIDVQSTTFTPRSSSSTIYVYFHANLWQNSQSVLNGADFTINLQVSGGSSYVSRTDFFNNPRVAGNFGGNGSLYLHSHFDHWASFTNSDTSTKTIYLQGAQNTSQTSGLDIGHSQEVSFFIKEVLR